MWIRVALLIALLCAPAWAKPKAGNLCREARVLVEQHKIKPAVAKYFQALKLDPRCAEAHAGLGELYYHASTNEGKPKLDDHSPGRGSGHRVEPQRR